MPIYFELDFVDTNSAASLFGSFVECDYVGQNCIPHPVAGGGPSDCATGGFICSGLANNGGLGLVSADLTPDGITVDNYLHSYRLYANSLFAYDGSIKIAGMVVGYVLQVSQPTVQTFTDVPPSNIFYQYIEALAASGITGGCGGGNYCPNNPVTRGQMAVFLAKALGLQWP